MATLSEQIITVNNLGRNNLAEKGVTVSEDAKTYEIMQSIADIETTKNIEESKQQITADSAVDQILLPTALPSISTKISNGIIIADTSASLEE